jgi:hypothetical protein
MMIKISAGHPIIITESQRYDEDGEKVIHLTSKMHLDRSLMKKFQKVVNKNNSNSITSRVKNSERKRNDL